MGEDGERLAIRAAFVPELNLPTRQDRVSQTGHYSDIIFGPLPAICGLQAQAGNGGQIISMNW